MNREVLCSNCKYYLNDPNFKYPPGKNTGTDVHTVCNCPYNIDKSYSSKDPRKYISTPSIINRNHNCNWFNYNHKTNTYVWDNSDVKPGYKDHGQGTYNINPVGGADGFYIGESSLSDLIEEGGGSGRIDELEEKVDQLTVTVSGHDTKITQIETLTNQHETKITQLNTVVAGHDTKITQLNDKVDGFDDRILELEITTDTHTTQIQSLQLAVQSHDNDLTQIKTKVQNLDNRVSANTQSIANLNENIINLTDKVDKYTVQPGSHLTGGGSVKRPDGSDE